MCFALGAGTLGIIRVASLDIGTLDPQKIIDKTLIDEYEVDYGHGFVVEKKIPVTAVHRIITVDLLRYAPYFARYFKTI